MGFSGRTIRVRRGSTDIAGARTDGVTINNEPLDATDKDDLGWRTLLADAGGRSVDLTISGVTLNATYIALALGAASGLRDTFSIEIDGVGTASGLFFINTVSKTGEQADVITFEMTLLSAGAITWTAA